MCLYKMYLSVSYSFRNHYQKHLSWIFSGREINLLTLQLISKYTGGWFRMTISVWWQNYSRCREIIEYGIMFSKIVKCICQPNHSKAYGYYSRTSLICTRTGGGKQRVFYFKYPKLVLCKVKLKWIQFWQWMKRKYFWKFELNVLTVFISLFEDAFDKLSI